MSFHQHDEAAITETSRFHAFVRGVVQGVAFRASTAREARRLGLVGWVRNVPDGSVEVTAEGLDKSVRALLTYLHRGPPSARVEDVTVEWLPARGDFTGFDVTG